VEKELRLLRLELFSQGIIARDRTPHDIFVDRNSVIRTGDFSRNH
jgi:hypothetical protein